ncbi:MAG: nuclear transport factor 2 family protein, partial [Thermoleophilia bacterium]|nr:nuclear transport factor 2 family protein [Thermoleophilia bacterium]
MNAEETMRALAAAWEHGDPDAIADRFAPDGVYEGPLFDGFPVGPAA